MNSRRALHVSSPGRFRPLIAGLALFGLACGSPDGDLVAPDGAHRMVANDVSSGLSVVMTTAVWPGDSDLESDLTIVHILVSNTGPHRVRLAPGDFEMRDGRGFLYPLRDAGGRFRRSGTHDRNYAPGQSLSFSALPLNSYNRQLARDALPWGVLEPGTSMRGFVYFDRLERRANLATLVWHASAANDRSLVDIKFPLAVSR